MRFDSYHPMINFIFFASVIVLTILFRHPVFLAVSFAAGFAYSIKLNGIRAAVFNTALVPFIAAYAFIYSYYNHFGAINLGKNIIGNQITLEAVAYGGVIGTIAAAVILWFSCVHAVVSSDKVVYLFGRIAPRLSLFLSILLRTVPRVKNTARRIDAAQRAVGRGIRQGNPVRRFLSAVRLLSVVTTWTLENFIETSDSMRSRGCALRGRTAFSIYRFDNRDRSFVITIFFALTVVGAGYVLDQTHILYNPQIVMNPITPLSFVFYTAYAFVCLLPMTLQIAGERKFRRLKEKACSQQEGINH